jgi:hypothetical protein
MKVVKYRLMYALKTILKNCGYSDGGASATSYRLCKHLKNKNISLCEAIKNGDFKEAFIELFDRIKKNDAVNLKEIVMSSQLSQEEKDCFINIVYGEDKDSGSHQSSPKDYIKQIIVSTLITSISKEQSKEYIEATLKEANLELNMDDWIEIVVDSIDKINQNNRAYLKSMMQNLSKLEKKLLDRKFLFDTLKEAIQILPPPKPIQIKKDDKKDKEEPILLISDCHIGETVNLPFSQYNLDIARQMADFIIQTSIKLIKQRLAFSYYDNIYIFILGDIVSGIIHNELVKYSIEASKQIIEAAYILAHIINNISVLGNVKVFCVVGNHGRITSEKRYKDKWDNLDFIVYHFIKEILKYNKKVEVNIPESPFAVVNVSNFNFLLHHGDNIRGYAGIPYYGLNRADNAYVVSFLKSQQIIIHYIVRGHFHTATTLQAPFGETIINGSWKGADEYTFENFKTYSEPQQLMLWVHERRGLVWRTPIKLTEFITKQ